MIEKKLIYMIMFVSFVYIGVITKAESNAKCCPTSKFLYGEKMSCVNSSVITDSYVIAENAYQNYSNLPDCDTKQVIHFDWENNYDAVSVDCIDVHFDYPKFDSYQLVGVKCNTSNSSRKIVPSSWFKHINKCCPKYQLFDYNSRLCVQTNKSLSQNLLHLTMGLSRYLGFFHKPVRCHHALVDYEFESRQFIIDNSSAIFINLTLAGGGEMLDLSKKQFCLDETTSEIESFVVRVCETNEYCDKNNCLQKCSFHDEVISSLDKLPMDLNFNTNLHHAIFNSDSIKFYNIRNSLDHDQVYGLTMNIQCSEYSPIKRWWLNSNGQLHLGDHRRFVNHTDYCLETVYYEHDNYVDIELYLCKDTSESPSKTFRILLTITSSLFILLSIIFYSVTSFRRTMYHYCFIVFLGHYLIGHICSAMSLMNAVPKSAIGCYWGHIIYYFSITSYTWLVIMVHELYYSLVKISTVNETFYLMSTKFRLCLHCLTSVAIGMGLTMIVIIMDNFDVIPIIYRPNMSCLAYWFEHLYTDFNMGNLLYYLTPSVILLCLSSVYLILTSGKISEMRAAFYNNYHDNKNGLFYKQYKSYRNQYTCSIILVTVVLLPVILEVAEIILDCFKPNVFANFTTSFQYIYDALLTVQGIVIFVVYICRIDVLRSLQRKVNSDYESDDTTATRMIRIMKS